MKEVGGKTGVLGLDLPSEGGGTESGGTIPTAGQLSESEEKHLRLRVKQLICGSLNVMRIRQSLPQPYIPGTGVLVPWKAVSGSWGLGIVEQSQSEGCCSLQREGSRGCWEEILGGNACGGTPGSHGSKAILLSHTRW